MPAPKPFAPAGTPRRWVRPRHFRITHVVLDVRIDLAERRITGAVTHTVEFLPHARDRVLILDRHGVHIDSVKVDGQELPFSLGEDQVIIEVPAGAGAVPVRVGFTTEQPLKGIYFIDADPAREQVAMCWTQGAMEDHSWWFPCFDDPNNLSTYAVRIRHDAELSALSNGVCEGIEKRDDGTAITTYRQDLPHVLYLLNVAVGEFERSDDEQGPVRISHWVPRGKSACSGPTFRSTAFALQWLGDYIGVPYAWKRYGHVVVHQFMWGGMENTTLTTITDRRLVTADEQRIDEVDADRLVIHELVHQWFGDLLTMKGWSDIWLNESFATYLEALGYAAWRAEISDDDRDAVLAAELYGNWSAYLAQEHGRYSRALVTDRWADAYELFDRVAYEKGSLVLHHLAAVMGEEAFRAALARYTETHRHDLVETADFRQACEDVSGDPLDWFFAQWVHQAGHPKLKVRSTFDAARKRVLITIEQQQAATDAERAFRLPTAIAWCVGDEIHRREITIEQATEVVVVPAESAPTWLCVDPDGHLPAEWDEGTGDEALLARAHDEQAGVLARARAVDALAGVHPFADVVDGLLRLLNARGVPRLVRERAAEALGSIRHARGRDGLLACYGGIESAGLRRCIADALAKFRGDVLVAEHLETLAGEEPSAVSVGSLLAARGAIRVPGAVPVLRRHMLRGSWNEQLRAGAVRGLGASGEAAAIDEVLPLIGSADEDVAVRAAAAGSAAALGVRHALARVRVREALIDAWDDAPFMLRAAIARALGALGDPAARGALGGFRQREIYGIITRIIRESEAKLAELNDARELSARLGERVDELESKLKQAESAIEQLNKRLDA